MDYLVDPDIITMVLTVRSQEGQSRQKVTTWRCYSAGIDGRGTKLQTNGCSSLCKQKELGNPFSRAAPRCSRALLMHFDFGSSTAREHISVVLSHRVCDHLLLATEDKHK